MVFAPKKASVVAGRPRLQLVAWLAAIVALSSCLERGKERRAEPASAERSSRVAAKPSAEALPTIVGLRDREPLGPADPNAAIRLRLPAQPLHLNPMLAGDSIAVSIALGDVYEGLLQIARPGSPAVPALAQHYEPSADGKDWVFHLRRDVRFHDNTLLTTKDVLRSFALLSESASPLRAEFDDLISLREQGEGTLHFSFRESRAARLEAFAAVPILSAAEFKDILGGGLPRAAGSLAPIGTGPLQFVKWRGNEIHLRRFAGYWGAPALAKDIHYRVIADQERALAELRAHRLHALLGLPIADALKSYEKGSGLSLVRQSLPAFTALVFNTETSVLSLKLRRILAASIDRASVVRELFLNQVDVASGPFVVASDRADPTLAAPAFSLAASRRELGKLGQDIEPLKLLVPDSSQTMQRLADIWIEDLRGVLPVEVQRLPFAELLTRVRAGAFDLVFLSFSTSDAVDLYSLFHSSEIGSGNLSRIRDASLDALLVQLRVAGDRAEMVRLSQALHRRLVELAPVAFLSTDARLGIVDEDLGGVGDTATIWGARAMWLGK